MRASAYLNLVPPFVGLPPETEQLRDEVREFLANERADDGFVPHCDVWLSGWDERFSRALGARGWLGMTLLAEYGGHGRSGPDGASGARCDLLHAGTRPAAGDHPVVGLA